MHSEDAGVALIMIGYGIPVTGCPQGLVSSSHSSPLRVLQISSGSFTYSSTGTSGSRTLTGTLTTAALPMERCWSATFSAPEL